MGRKENLIRIEDIDEEMRLIDGSITDYITPTAKVYKDYGNGYFYPKKTYQNNHNLYLYVNITFSDGVNRNSRLHRLLADAYIPNPNPDMFKYVGHKDNVKWNCSIDNLYWTTNQENTKKASDDGLSIEDKAEEDSQSFYIKVKDKDTHEIVGVYGSINQCARCIENVSVGYISKMCKQENYKPRTKKYIYQISNKEEFDKYKELQNMHLIEYEPVSKAPKLFRMINKKIGYDEVWDNQKQASKVCNVDQAIISHCIKRGVSYGDWEFIYLDELKYKESTSFQNLLNLCEDVKIKNINTNEMLEFKCKQDMLNHFGIVGNDTSGYFNKGFKIMHEWIVV